MDIEDIRRQIPVTRRCIYMNTGWSGPLPGVVVQAATRVLDEEMSSGPATLDAVETSRIRSAETSRIIANLLHVSPVEILLTRNTTEGLNLAINALQWRQRDTIVTCSLEHPSVTRAIQNIRLRHKVRVRQVDISPHDSSELILSKFEEALTTGVRLLFLSHIQYSCGLRLPARELVDLAHKRGALVLFDGAQTGGQIQLDLGELGADMYSLAGQKWLLGPDGTGALYIREDLIPELHPVLSPSMEGTSEYGPRNKDTTKFLGGSHSGTLQAAQAAATEFVCGVGLETIEERSRNLGKQLREGLATIDGVTIASPWEESLTSGLITFAVQGWEPANLVASLWNHSRIAGREVSNPAGVRLCTAFFNTGDEVDQVVASVLQMSFGGGRHSQ